MNLRAEFEKLPFKSSEDDWRCYMVVETADEAHAFITTGESAEKPVWVHLPLTRLIASGSSAGISEHSAFVEVGAGMQRWLKAEQPASDAVYHIEFRGWRSHTLALIFDDAVYVWSPEGIDDE